MAISDGNQPRLDGIHFTTQSIVAAAADTVSTNNKIRFGVKSVTVTGVTADANDWVRLPSLADVQIGHEIVIYAAAGANFELRTPASSNEKINDVDADGSQEYLVTDTDTVRIWKISSTAWAAQSITKLGAVRTAVVPD